MAERENFWQVLDHLEREQVENVLRDSLTRADARQLRLDALEDADRRLMEAVRQNISFLRFEASAGRELALNSLDPEEQFRYRVRAEAYEWAADNFAEALDPAGLSESACPECGSPDVCRPDCERYQRKAREEAGRG